jgi:hypothetical protein
MSVVEKGRTGSGNRETKYLRKESDIEEEDPNKSNRKPQTQNSQNSQTKKKGLDRESVSIRKIDSGENKIKK